MRERSRYLLPLVLLCCCTRSPELPELPAADLKRFTPAVAAAITAAATAARARPDDAEAVGRYCMVLHAHNQFTLAASCYARASRLAAGSFRWAYYVAVATSESGRPQDALRALDRALQIEPGYLAARLRRAEALLESGRTADSTAAYRALIRDVPDSAEAHYGLARALAADGKMKEATAEYERACKLFPPYSAAHYAAAQLYRRLGDPERARAHSRLYAASDQMRPPRDDVHMLAIRELSAGGQTHIERSLALEAAGRLEEAASANLEALSIDASSVRAHVNLISLYGRMRRFPEAEQHYTSAIALNPTNAEAHYNFGVMLVDRGRLREAQAAFRRAADCNPQHADAHYNYAVLTERIGATAEALKYYQQAVRLAPTHRRARQNLARLLIGGGRSGEAIEHFRLLLEPEDQGTADIQYGLATASFRLGDVTSALAHTRKAHELAVRYGRQDLIGRLEHDLKALGRRTAR